MSTLVLERPKDVDLAELFEIKVNVIPGLDCVKSAVLDWRTIPLGNQTVYWKMPAGAEDAVNGLVVFWPSRKKTEWFTYTGGTYYIRQFDTLVVNIVWHI